jgi:hypothetical protein
MPPTLVSPPRASDARPIIGLAAILCGLWTLVSALRNPDGSPVLADADPPPVARAAVEISTNRPVSDPEIASVAGMPQAMPHIPGADPGLQPAEKHGLSGSVEGLARASMDSSTARWTAAWSVTRAGDDVPAYLIGSSTARWSRAIATWDDTSGYGAVEVSRANIE